MRGRTKVVNMKTDMYDMRIDRQTIFGNPFKIFEDGTRLNVIKKFRKYFIRRVKKEKWFREQVENLRGQRLGCHCKPLPCHGDVIMEYLEGE